QTGIPCLLARLFAGTATFSYAANQQPESAVRALVDESEVGGRCVMVDLKVPTFDGHLNWSNTALEEVSYGIRAAQEIDARIRARSGSSGGDEREAEGAAGAGAGRTCRPVANVAAGV